MTGTSNSPNSFMPAYSAMPMNTWPVAMITTLTNEPPSATSSGTPNISTAKIAGRRLTTRREASRNCAHGNRAATTRAKATSLSQTHVSNRKISASGNAARREGRLSKSSKAFLSRNPS